MANRTTTGADGSGNGRAAAYTALTTTEKTSMQVSTICGLLNTLKDFTAPVAEAGKEIEVSDEVRAAADKTTVLALHQLDNILDDMRRWSIDTTGVEHEHERMLQANTKLIEAQQADVAEGLRPSMRLNVPLVLTERGQYAAILIDTDQVLGLGNTPAEAFADFDRNFRHLTPAVQKRLTKETENLRARANKVSNSAPA